MQDLGFQTKVSGGMRKVLPVPWGYIEFSDR